MLNPSKRRSRRVFVFIHPPGSLTGICAVDVTQLAEAEAITSRWVDITIHSHYRTAGGHLEHLPHLNVHFKVGDRAPKLWSCNENSKLCEALTVNKTLFFQYSAVKHIQTDTGGASCVSFYQGLAECVSLLIAFAFKGGLHTLVVLWW